MQASNRPIVSCHCGAMRAAVTIDPNSEPAMMCNCSICSRTGALMRFVPEAAIEILSAGEPTDYQFNKRHIHHLFCSTCGVRPWGHGKDREGGTLYMVNLRCMEGLDATGVEVQHVDGKSL